MLRAVDRRWRFILVVLAIVAIPAAIAYAVMTQVIKTVPGTVEFVAGLELAPENLGASTDLEGTQPIDDQNPVTFPTLPDFEDLRFWSPVASQCFYIHNNSDETGLGPPTDLIVDVTSEETSEVTGQLSLVQCAFEDGDGPIDTIEDARELTRTERLIRPGENVRLRVLLKVFTSPGEGPFNFNIVIGGISPVDVLGKDLLPTAMEVTQGIQNLANDMPLVEDRRTIVRVYVENDGFGPFDTDISSVRARLHATRGGGGLSGSPINAKNNPITVEADGGDRRNLDDSFWFYLPSGWRSGTVTLRAEIDYNDTVDETDESNNEISTTVTFNGAQTFNAVLVPLHLHDAGIFWGTESYRWDLYNNVYRLHPISDLDMWRFTSSLKPEDHSDGNEWDLTDSSDRSEALTRIWWLDSKTTDWVSELHYVGGVEAATDTSTSSGGQALGKGYTSGSDLQSWVKMINRHDGHPDWYITGGNSMAHELGHNEARKHVDCKGTESGTDPGYPNPNPDCHLDDVDDAGYFGTDVYYSKWGLSEPAIIDNDDDGFPLMGYKRPRWIDPYTYCALLNRYGVSCGLIFTGGPDIDQDPPPPPPGGDFSVTVNGLIGSSGIDGAFFNIELQPTADIFPDTIAKWQKRHQSAQDMGPFFLDVFDFGGQLLASHTVVPLESIEEHEDTSPLAFLEVIPWPGGAVRLVLRNGPTVLDQRDASPGVPTVVVNSPAPGDTPGDTIVVRWTATDPDGDPLTFNLLFSKDAGISWRPIALGIRETQYAINVEEGSLPGGDQGLFRVEVNDGFHLNRDDADVTVVVPGNRPMVTIHSPLTGAELDGRTNIVLDGEGEDVEDGRLVGAALEWSSDVDGVLGTGTEVFLDESALTPGAHQITLTATDSDGTQDVATVEVFVQ